MDSIPKPQLRWYTKTIRSMIETWQTNSLDLASIVPSWKAHAKFFPHDRYHN